jgi:hypothetical protein
VPSAGVWITQAPGKALASGDTARTIIWSAAPQPLKRRTWRIRIGPTGAQALREHPRLGLEFPTGNFAPDPRLDGMVWKRPRAQRGTAISCQDQFGISDRSG